MKDVQIIELGNEDIEVILDSYALTWSEILGNPTNSKSLVELLNKLLAEKISKRVEPLVAGTHSKITYDENGLVVAGEDLSIEDLPKLHLNNIVDVEATSEEVNKLHGLKATKNEIDRLHGITATTSEFNILHGLQANTEELSRLKGLLIASAQLNMLQGIKSNVQAQLDNKMDKLGYEVENKANKTNNYNTTSAETYPSSKALKAGLDTKQDKLTETQLNNLNKAITTENIEEAVSGKLDKNVPIQPDEACKVEYDENGLIIGKKSLEETDIPAIRLNKISDVNVSASELNQLKGLEADANDLNQLKGVENNVQLQFDTITQLLPDEATVDNKLADKQYVKNYVYDTTGFFLSKDAHNTPFKSMAELLNTHTFYDNGKIKRISEHDYTVVTSDETRNNSVSLYAWIRDEIYNEGHWVFQYKISNSYDDLTFDWGNIIGNITNQTDLMNEFKKDRNEIKDIKENMSTKQDVISDLETIREGASKGATALQSYTEIDPIYMADKPKIALKSELPTKVSDLTNDTGFITNAYHDNTKQDVISDLSTIRSGAAKGATALQSYTEIDPVYTKDKPKIALKSELPTLISQLTNDKGFVTSTEVTQAIAQIPQFQLSIVNSLPATGAKMTLYLVPKDGSGDDIYNEYIWIEQTGRFEFIGTTAVDLSEYYTKSEVITQLDKKEEKLTAINAGDNILIDRVSTEGISSAYDLISYVQSNGNQFIDTGIVPIGTDTVTIKYKHAAQVDNGTYGFFGCMPSSNITMPRFSFGCAGGKDFIGFNATADTCTIDTEWHVATMSYNVEENKYYKQIDGSVLAEYSVGTPNSQPTLTAYIFSRHGDDGVQVNDFKGTAIEYIDWYNADGTQKAKFVACRRKTDSAVGFYEMVSGTFFTADGLVGGNLVYITKISAVVPTKVSQLTNDSGYITSSYHDKTKQDVISDLATIRSGASKGATALQAVPPEYITEAELNNELLSKEDLITSNNAGDNIKIERFEGLPSEYQLLEYIISDGNIYIDTGIIATAQTGLRIKYKYVSDGSAAIAGVFQNNQPRTDTLFISSNTGTTSSTLFVAHAGTQLDMSTAIVLNTTYICEINYLNSGIMAVDGLKAGTIGSNNIYEKSIPLFARYNPNTNSYAISKSAIYSATFTEGNSISHKLLPVRRKSDNVLGMYDTVANTFMVGTGNGSFTAGPEVNASVKISAVVPTSTSQLYNDSNYVMVQELSAYKKMSDLMTEAEYEALTTKDPNTLYLIEE